MSWRIFVWVCSERRKALADDDLEEVGLEVLREDFVPLFPQPDEAVVHEILRDGGIVHVGICHRREGDAALVEQTSELLFAEHSLMWQLLRHGKILNKCNRLFAHLQTPVFANCSLR